MSWGDAELLLIALAAMLSPTTLSFSVLLLALVLGERPLRTGVWFYLGALSDVGDRGRGGLRARERSRLAHVDTEDMGRDRRCDRGRALARLRRAAGPPPEPTRRRLPA